MIGQKYHQALQAMFCSNIVVGHTLDLNC